MLPKKPVVIPQIMIAYLMLVSRLVLFVVFQLLIALILGSWKESQFYWLLTATLANIVCIVLLYKLFMRDGKSYLQLFTFDRTTLKKDITIFAVLAVVSVPVALIPGYLLGSAIWGDPDFPGGMMFGPVNKWLAYILLFAFPVTIAMAELATYFVYVLNKLKERLKMKWLAVMLPVLLLSIQHCALPFIPDVNFILYRALMFLPFAILIGITLSLRPSLFIYFAIFHGLMDLGTALVLVMESQ